MRAKNGPLGGPDLFRNRSLMLILPWSCALESDPQIGSSSYLHGKYEVRIAEIYFKLT